MVTRAAHTTASEENQAVFPFLEKGFYKGRIIDERGAKYGRLLVVDFSHTNGDNGRTYWKCKCTCGKEVIAQGKLLRNGHIKSCGCLQRDMANSGGGYARRKFRRIKFSDELLDVLNGQLLGDGSLTRPDGRNTFFQVLSSKRNYIYGLSDILTGFRIPNKIYETMQSTRQKAWHLHSCHAKSFNTLYERWYIPRTKMEDCIYKNPLVKNFKIVPKTLQLNKIVILHWHLGDGSINWDNTRKKSIIHYVKLSTCGFLHDDVEWLAKQIREKFGIECKARLNGHAKPYKEIFITGQENIKKYFDLIGPCPDWAQDYRHRWPTEEEYERLNSRSMCMNESERQEIERLFDLGLSDREISQHVNRSAAGINNFLIREGLKRPGPKRLSVTEKQRIRDLFDSGLSKVEIAKQIGRSITPIDNLLRKEGLLPCTANSF